ncbi:MAG TPA: FtsW/RodA/SpoVE family cell cycle protein, partial [Candidatus Saccharibacteria bacterium]|nr:FtsW/RodA/SpoVE family cell cycle protein [Candidatus Saccharibacteria bacterium]
MAPRRRSRVASPQQEVAAGIPTVRRHRPDYQIVLFMGLLILIGLIVLYSISPARVELINVNSNATLDTTHFMERQLVNIGIGLVAFAAAAMLPRSFWEKYAAMIFWTGIGACVVLALLGLVMDDGLVIKTNGAVRWFNLGITSFQPAELVKFGIIIFAAVFLGKRVKEGTVNNLQATLIPVGILMAIAGLLIIVFQKDMGTGITLFGIILAMLYVAGVNKKLLGLGIAGLAVAGVLLIVTSPHRMDRVLTFFNPTTVGDASSYHINQAMIALGSGGMFGKGLGQGVQAFGYLPEAVNDSIFAILGETFGFLGILLILLLFAALLRRILKTMDTTVDPTLKLMVAGVFGLLSTHIIVNVGAMTGIFPLTGVTLPF